METTSHSIAVDLRDVQYTWAPRQPFSLSIPEFRVRSREKLLLLGPSGSGKSTLLNLMTGIVQPQGGTVSILGQDLGDLSTSGRDRYRAEHFGIIFQMFNLLPYGAVLDNVLLPLSFAPMRRMRAAKVGGAEAEARRLLDALGLPTVVARQSAATLSVGQQQRVAAARALIGSPEIVIADEPTSALDEDRQQDFLDLLFSQIEATHATLVMVSHDRRLAPKFDRVLELPLLLGAPTRQRTSA